MNPDNTAKVIYTIGHSNHPVERFIELLGHHRIEVLVDIRSSPYSKHTPQFDLKNIKRDIEAAGIRYLYLGKELGGMPKDQEFYDSRGEINYAALAESPSFREGISRLKKGLQQYRLALMCSEENPENCHRWLLVGRTLLADGITVINIRGSGEMEVHDEFKPEIFLSRRSQLPLF